MGSHHNNLRNLFVTGVLICVFLGVNVLTPGYWLRANWVSVVVAGFWISQLTLVVTWPALAPRNFSVRLPWSLLLLVFMWYALVIGNRMANRFYNSTTALVLGLILLSGWLFAVIALRIVARVLGWQLLGWNAGQDGDGQLGGRPPFPVRHLLLGTFLLLMAIAPMRLVLPPPGPLPMALYDLRQYIYLAVAAVANLVLAVPCIWAAFAPVRRMPLLGLRWLVTCTLLTGLQYVHFFLFLGPFVPFSLIFTIHLAHCGFVLGTLLIFRGLGCRLVQTSQPADAVGLS
ncbi:MAG: hypothetical protein EA424_01580 [Planctomycetaceae bacterium]|nr:MAG: hypothetical protein EA424_01580 [Planctomycetaceae bacterium]